MGNKIRQLSDTPAEKRTYLFRFGNTQSRFDGSAHDLIFLATSMGANGGTVIHVDYEENGKQVYRLLTDPTAKQGYRIMREEDTTMPVVEATEVSKGFMFRNKPGTFNGKTLTLSLQLMTMKPEVKHGEAVFVESKDGNYKKYYVVTNHNRTDTKGVWVQAEKPEPLPVNAPEPVTAQEALRRNARGTNRTRTPEVTPAEIEAAKTAVRGGGSTSKGAKPVTTEPDQPGDEYLALTPIVTEESFLALLAVARSNAAGTEVTLNTLHRLMGDNQYAADMSMLVKQAESLLDGIKQLQETLKGLGK